jgi:hypothetical protein
MERDGVLQEMLKFKLRRDKSLVQALAQFGEGQEAEALATLAARHPRFAPLVGPPVEELFLIAAVALARSYWGRSLNWP